VEVKLPHHRLLKEKSAGANETRSRRRLRLGSDRHLVRQAVGLESDLHGR
jgi:hypothetical protein